MKTKKKTSRNTRQQQAVLRELRRVDTHPTADELFLRVRRAMPRISLATVYRNLTKLAEKGQVTVLDAAAGQRRYDGNHANHLHVRCRDCDRVADATAAVPFEQAIEPLSKLKDPASFKVEGCKVELIGLCQSCQTR